MRGTTSPENAEGDSSRLTHHLTLCQNLVSGDSRLGGFCVHWDVCITGELNHEANVPGT